MSSGHDPAMHATEDEVAPWDSPRVWTVVVWALAVAAVSLLFPIVLNRWSEQILHGVTTGGSG